MRRGWLRNREQGVSDRSEVSARLPWRAGAAASIAVVLLAGCSGSGQGPLAGPRAEPDTVTICTRGVPDRQMYFGEPLSNRGTEQVVITKVEGKGENLASVDYFIDAEGPPLDEILGSFRWPAEPDSDGAEERVLSRMVAAEDVVIEPNDVVVLIMKPVPSLVDQYVAVTESVVHYTSDGRSFRESVSIEYGVDPDAQC